MYYQTKILSGRGIGRKLGFPTLNLALPEKLDAEHGIYAGWVLIEEEKYKGAFHYGPIPVFNDIKISLEVYVLDVFLKKTPQSIKFELEKKLRDIMDFPTPQEMVKQIEKDVNQTRTVLKAIIK